MNNNYLTLPFFPNPNINTINTIWCVNAKQTYDIKPDVSWGSLPVAYQSTWDSLNCNTLLSLLPASSTRPSSYVIKSPTKKICNWQIVLIVILVLLLVIGIILTTTHVI